jgi:Fur family ferric uptake transcriptional regulator
MSQDDEKLGKKKTVQRDAIFQVIRQAKGPLTVSEILDHASDSIAGLGIATVYRTVKLLLESDRIQTVTLPDGQTRYEPADLGHHHHFRCRLCDEVFDLDVCPVEVPHGAVLPGGFLVEDHELTLYGTCPDCSGNA